MRKLRIEIDLEVVDRDHDIDKQVVGWIANSLRSYASGVEALQHVPEGRVPLRGLSNKVIGSAWVENAADVAADR